MQPITNFERRMRLVFGMAFAVLLSTVAVSLFVINRLNVNSEWVVHTHEVIGVIHNIHTHFGDARVGTKNYLLTRQSRHLAPRLSAIQAMEESLANLRVLTADNPSQQGRIKEAMASVRDYIDLTVGIISEVDRLKEIPYDKFGEWTDKTEASGHRVKLHLMTMTKEEEGLLVARQKAAESFSNQAQGIMPFMLTLQLAITSYIYYGVLYRPQ